MSESLFDEFLLSIQDSIKYHNIFRYALVACSDDFLDHGNFRMITNIRFLLLQAFVLSFAKR